MGLGTKNAEFKADAIEGSILITPQMGWEIPPIPDSDVRINIFEIDSAD
jgi:hypothetical protein